MSAEPMPVAVVPPSPLVLPYLLVGGVKVYAWVEDGVLSVSVDYEDADDTISPGSATVPTRVMLSGGEVYFAR